VPGEVTGGNLALAGSVLLIATADRLAAYRDVGIQ
jgi:hypothetical protein